MKKSTKIIIAVVSVLVVVAAVVAILYFKTGLFNGLKKPKNLFYEYLEQATSSEEGTSYSEYISKLKKVKDESYKSKGKITMDVELGSYLSEYDEIADLLNKIEINFESKTKPSSLNEYMSMNLKYDGEDLGTFEILADEKQFGIKLDDMYDKYLTMTYDEMMEVLEDEGIDMDLSSVSFEDIDTDAIIDVLDIKDEEISRIVERYKNVLQDTIPEDNYSSEKEKITVNGEEINATAYIVKISDKDLVKLAKAFVKSLADDDDTIDLLVDKVNKIMDIAGEETTLSTSTVKAILENAISSLESVDELTGEELKIKIYEHDNKTVRIAFAMEDDAVMIDTTKDGETEKMAIKIVDNGEEMTLLNIEQTKNGEEKYTTKLSTDIEGIKLELTVDTEESDTLTKANIKVYVDIQGMIKATLNMDSEVEYTSVSIDKLSSSNSTKISSMTSAQQKELANGLLDYIEEHMDVIKDIATTIGYEDEIEAFEKQINSLKSTETVTTTDNDEDLEDDEDVA